MIFVESVGQASNFGRSRTRAVNGCSGTIEMSRAPRFWSLCPSTFFLFALPDGRSHLQSRCLSPKLPERRVLIHQRKDLLCSIFSVRPPAVDRSFLDLEVLSTRVPQPVSDRNDPLRGRMGGQHYCRTTAHTPSPYLDAVILALGSKGTCVPCLLQWLENFRTSWHMYSGP